MRLEQTGNGGDEGNVGPLKSSSDSYIIHRTFYNWIFFLMKIINNSNNKN